MASWIVHLRIAEALLERITGLEAGPFAVGSIAPDSGIPDEKWEHFNPPPGITHFEVTDDGKQAISDLAFYRRHLAPLRGRLDRSTLPFRIGYFFHLVTDRLWSVKIGRPTQVRWTAEFAADRDFIWEVKKDWYGLDFLYVRSHPRSLFWQVFLTADPLTGGLDFLPPDAVRQRVEYIRRYYQRTDEEVMAAYDRPYIYLSETEMDRFVDESSDRLIRIYNHLWLNDAAAGEAVSALDLIS